MGRGEGVEEKVKRDKIDETKEVNDVGEKTTDSK